MVMVMVMVMVEHCRLWQERREAGGWEGESEMDYMWGREWKGEGCSGANYRKQRQSGLTVEARRRNRGMFSSWSTNKQTNKQCSLWPGRKTLGFKAAFNIKREFPSLASASSLWLTKDPFSPNLALPPLIVEPTNNKGSFVNLVGGDIFSTQTDLQTFPNRVCCVNLHKNFVPDKENVWLNFVRKPKHRKQIPED